MCKEVYLAEFWQVFDRTAPHRLFTTEHGYLSVGPDRARVGDQIFLALGYCVPLVIRGRGQWFHVVADAFVAAVMQGEVFRDDAMLPPHVTEIVLK